MARPRSDAAHEKVLTETAALALDAGLAAVTMDEVARRSGVAKTTIYRHFGDRTALLIAALDAVIAPPTAPDTGSLESDLVAFYRELLPIFANPDARTLSFEVQAAALRDPKLEALRAAFFRDRMGPLLSLLDRAVSRGELAGQPGLLEAIETVEGPFILRSLTAPETLATLDLESLASRAASQLRASGE